MIHRGLVLIACVCCGLVLASFAMFARDQISGASIHQQNEISNRAPSNPSVPAATVHRAQPRRFIDDAARTLTSPFRSIVASSSQWVMHGIPAVLALLVYGVGLGYIARFSRGMA